MDMQFYSASFTGDTREVVKHVKTRYPNSHLYAVGWSLGANILVRYLGEVGWDVISLSFKYINRLLKGSSINRSLDFFILIVLTLQMIFFGEFSLNFRFILNWDFLKFFRYAYKLHSNIYKISSTDCLCLVSCFHSLFSQESENCLLSGAVSLCNPFNLIIADEDFRKGFNNIYDKALARSLTQIFKK